MIENKNYSVNKAWSLLFEKHDIPNKVAKDKLFYISSNDIKKFKEPRLMSKWDNSQSLPEPFKKKRINILPISRREYVLGNFMLYEDIPDITEDVKEMEHVKLPEFETIDSENINSEANAINVLILSGIIEHFLEVDDLKATFNGRMGTGKFSFDVNTNNKESVHINVENAQCEIDGGFECDDAVVILEAKNVVKEDFHIRQLYYPYRLWKSKVKKPIRLIFSVYSNKIFRLFEYRFEDPENFSSIKLVKHKNYSLEDTDIDIEDLVNVYKNTQVKYDDNMAGKKKMNAPFIQADSMDKVISLLENLYIEPLTKTAIAEELLDFTSRQADYYYNAGKYLGLFKLVKQQKGEESIVQLTNLGKSIYKKTYKERQLKIVELMLQHQIFHECFEKTYTSGEIISKAEIELIMKRLNVCTPALIDRRSRSVYGWVKWMFNLIKLNH